MSLTESNKIFDLEVQGVDNLWKLFVPHPTMMPFRSLLHVYITWPTLVSVKTVLSKELNLLLLGIIALSRYHQDILTTQIMTTGTVR